MICFYLNVTSSKFSFYLIPTFKILHIYSRVFMKLLIFTKKEKKKCSRFKWLQIKLWLRGGITYRNQFKLSCI